MLDHSSKEDEEFFVEHGEEEFSVHDSSVYDDYLRGNEECDVEAELSQIVGNQSPDLGLVSDLGKGSQSHFQPVSNGLIAHHSCKTRPIFMQGADSHEAFILFRRAFDSVQIKAYAIWPPSGCDSPCITLPWLMTPTSTLAPTVTQTSDSLTTCLANLNSAQAAAPTIVSIPILTPAKASLMIYSNFSPLHCSFCEAITVPQSWLNLSRHSGPNAAIPMNSNASYSSLALTADLAQFSLTNLMISPSVFSGTSEVMPFLRLIILKSAISPLLLVIASPIATLQFDMPNSMPTNLFLSNFLAPFSSEAKLLMKLYKTGIPRPTEKPTVSDLVVIFMPVLILYAINNDIIAVIWRLLPLPGIITSNCPGGIRSNGLSVLILNLQQMSSKLPTHVQYRNGTYYGILENYQRNGHGLLILDNSQILLAQWRKNTVQGKYIYITDSIRAFGTMQNNRLDGYNILWIKPDSKDNLGERTVYGMFREDKLYGKAVIVENNVVMVSQFVNNELKEVINKQPVKDREVYEVLNNHFPKNMYTLEEFLLSFMKDAASSTGEEEEIPRYQPVVVNLGDERLFGYEQCFNKGKRYGFILKENKVISIGEHFNNTLEGIGRYYGQDFIQDGIFKDGYLKGIGIKYYRQGNKYTIGEHDGRSSLQKGFGFPNREICEIRKEFHLRSIYFYNDIIMLSIGNHLNALMNSIIMENRPKRSESPKFTEEYRARSPLKSNLYKYEVEQDYIEDSSPIKNKFSEYKPVDHRANKYFTLDEEEEDYDKKRQREKSIGSNQGYRPRNNEKELREKEQREREQREREKQAVSRFNNADPRDEYKGDSNSRARMGLPSQNRDRSGSKTNARSGVKDTREFVRQLQQQQKKKRLDLDKIYKQAGLYRRK